MTEIVTRFAPSPSGYLHIGHAYSALFAERAARQANGRFLLRIEDIDIQRCRPEFEEAIFEDLDWLGLSWEEPVRRQSDHFDEFSDALTRLVDLGVIYPCFCSRKQIRKEIAAADRAPHGPEGPHYPGTCRQIGISERTEKLNEGIEHAYRLDTAKALDMAGQMVWSDRQAGQVEADPGLFGDVVLARKDTPSSYHLACTWDDHVQGITFVTRGEDLFPSTHVHLLLQRLLGLQTPDYHHHKLLTNESGVRFAKRDKSLTIRSLREAGNTPEQVRQLAGF